MSRPSFRLAATAIAATIALTAIPMTTAAACGGNSDLDYKITNPYAGVNWHWQQYKAGFHNHTTESDGGNTATEMLETAYSLGFNVYAMTDHNVVNTTWDRTDTAKAQANPNYYLTTERMIAMNTGVGRDGKAGMIGLPYSDEQSQADHLNTFWTNWNNSSGATLESKTAHVDEMYQTSTAALKPLMHINHPPERQHPIHRHTRRQQAR